MLIVVTIFASSLPTLLGAANIFTNTPPKQSPGGELPFRVTLCILGATIKRICTNYSELDLESGSCSPCPGGQAEGLISSTWWFCLHCKLQFPKFVCVLQMG